MHAPPAHRQRRPLAAGEALALLGIAALGIAQPVLDLLGRHGTFFVARRLSAAEIVGLVVALLAAPLPLVGAVALAGRLRRPLGRRIHAAAVGALMALIALQAVHRLLDGTLALAVAIVAGTLAMLALGFTAAGRQLAALLGVALVVVPGAFLLQPPIRRLLSTGGLGSELHRSGARSPIVVVVFDEFAAVSLLAGDGTLDAQRFPGFADLASRSTRYANALAASDTTEYAVPALLTGRLPSVDQLPIAADHPRNLFTAFGGDYRIVALEDVTHLCPPELNALGEPAASRWRKWSQLASDLVVIWSHLTAPEPWRSRLPRLEARWAGFAAATPDGGPSGETAAGEVVGQVLDRPSRFRLFVQSISAEPQRSLYVHHNNLPHWPWEYLPSGRRYAAPPDRIPGLVNEVWQDDEDLTAQAMQRYLLQLQLVDRLVAELLARLDEVGIFDETLLVVTADHGVSFRPGDARRLYTDTNRSDVLTVPLFVKAPGQRRGEVVQAPVSALDVLPTLFDLLGVAAPWPTDGRSMRGRSRVGTRPILAKYRGRLEIDQTIDQEKGAMLERQTALFGESGGGLSAGVRPELHGRALDELDVVGELVVPGLRIDGQQLYRTVDLAAPFSLAWLSGALGSWPGARPVLVVGVNGVVATSTRAWRSEDGSWRFNALLPEGSLRQGANQIALLADEGDEDRFRRLRTERVEPRHLEVEEERAAALVSEDRRWPLRAGAVDGWFGVEAEGDRVVASGWAWNRAAAEPAAEVVLLSGGREVYSGSPNHTNPPVATELGISPTSLCGFRFELPRQSVPELRRHGLRAVAVSSAAVASELGVFYRLVERRPGVEIQVSSGRTIPVRADLEGGWLDQMERRPGGQLILEGWAASTAAGGLPEALATFAGDRCIHLGTVGLQRTDVAAHLGRADLVASGFRITVTLPDEHSEVRMFAVFPDNTAIELLRGPAMEGSL